MKLVRQDLTSGSVAKTLMKMAGAMLIGFVALAGFNVTDTYFVSRLGTKELAAMNFTFPVILTIGCMTRGLGIGIAAVVSKLIGAGKDKEVKRVSTDGLLLGLLVVVILVTVGILTIHPLFKALGATEETLPLVEQYMRIWYFGMVVIVVPMMGNNAIRATGDTLSPSIIMGADLALNAVLDPIMIFGFGPIPAMGIEGAALATVIARAFALFASLYILVFRKHMLTAEWPTFRRVMGSWKRVLNVGLPAAGGLVLMPIIAGVILKMVSTFGTAAVAAFGAAHRIEMLAVIPVIALGESMTPFVGQNFGAKAFERIQAAHRMATRFNLLWGACCVLLFFFVADSAAKVFSDDPAVHGFLALTLTIGSLAFGFKGLSQLGNCSMNAIEKPYQAWGVVVFRLAVLNVPCAAVGAWLGGYTGLIVGVTSAEIAAGMISVYVTRRLYAGAFSNWRDPMAGEDQPMPEADSRDADAESTCFS